MNKFIIILLAFIAFTACDQKTETTTVQPVETPPSAPVEQAPAEVPPTAVVNESAPAYMNVGLKGFKVPDTNLSSTMGEVVFINFWGSWCGPCRMEMPSIQALYDNYGDKVKFVTIAVERRPGAHIEYINSNGFTFPVYEATDPIETDLKPKGFPTTLILNKKGEIVVKDVGAADWNAKSVHEILDRLLAEPA
ncbi:MAG: TlpA disulfide reductase family protein [Weeksellaceae bacterium]|nr:TlpA disulfide reductase family protein [Weeksellaceae bacterium]